MGWGGVGVVFGYGLSLHLLTAGSLELKPMGNEGGGPATWGGWGFSCWNNSDYLAVPLPFLNLFLVFCELLESSKIFHLGFLEFDLAWFKKWFNLQTKAGDFHADDIVCEGSDEEWRNNFSEVEACTIKKSKTEKSNTRKSDRVRQHKFELDASQITDVHNYRIFVATWNVAGKSPPSFLNLEEWLHTSPPADLYVLGFQEIVPLNAGNVLGTEDNGPARKWQALIRRTLNSLPGSSSSCPLPSLIPDPTFEVDDDFAGRKEKRTLLSSTAALFSQ
ncbi:UNVERIFIED_CONTAM: Type IV inositol polyphosphate 5-phosphatase 7 [Sesamum latifolium]|uniref:Type IV inositol polyphosphate 5-phosphatase 7 n=1 Tax=Sesamum latifolium TaxID=2727402 RepID=A0AAW2XVM5_9LAMI